MIKNKFVKYGLLFLILVLVLCCLVSAADTITVTVSNPDNIPIDFLYYRINDQALQFGENIVSTGYELISVEDGVIEDLDAVVPSFPDGDYIALFYYLTYDEGSEGAFLVPSTFVYSDQVQYDNGVSNFYVVPSADNIELIAIEGSVQPVYSFVLMPAPPTVTDSIENVWSGILIFVVGALGSAGGLFYNSDTGLTFLGTLGIIGLSFGLGLLIFYFVSKFLRLRG